MQPHSSGAAPSPRPREVLLCGSSSFGSLVLVLLAHCRLRLRRRSPASAGSGPRLGVSPRPVPHGPREHRLRAVPGPSLRGRARRRRHRPRRRAPRLGRPRRPRHRGRALRARAVVVVFLGYMGVVIGGRKGEWFEPARIIAAFRDSRRLHQYKILDTSRDHRRPHRRHLRDGLPRGDAGGAAVRAARAAAGRRLLGLA